MNCWTQCQSQIQAETSSQQVSHIGKAICSLGTSRMEQFSCRLPILPKKPPPPPAKRNVTKTSIMQKLREKRREVERSFAKQKVEREGISMKVISRQWWTLSNSESCMHVYSRLRDAVIMKLWLLQKQPLVWRRCTVDVIDSFACSSAVTILRSRTWKSCYIDQCFWM